MPKTRIAEYDNTGVVQQRSISNTVYFPVVATTAGSPVLVSSVDQLDTILDATFDNETLEYRVCKYLLRRGFELVIQKVSGTATSYEPSALLKDKGVYDIRFLTSGLIRTSAVYQKLIDIAKDRGDCVALLDAVVDTTGTPAQGSAHTWAPYKLDNPSAETPTNIGIRGLFEGLQNGKYAAVFAPDWRTSNPNLYDVDLDDNNKGYVVLPASLGYLLGYANMIQNNPEWYAAAGPARGIIPELTGVEYEYSSAEIEVLQGRAATEEVALDDTDDNVGFAINPIANIRPSGIIIYGNRTLHNNDAVKKTIATSFLNVRNLISAVKKQLYNATRIYNFEQNSDLLWINFQSYVKPLLEKMKYGNGIAGYKFVRVATNAKARLKARLTIIPIEAVEDFDLEVYLEDTLNVAE